MTCRAFAVGMRSGVASSPSLGAVLFLLSSANVAESDGGVDIVSPLSVVSFSCISYSIANAP